MDRKTALLLENHFFCGITAMGYRCGRSCSLISFLYHHYIGLDREYFSFLSFVCGTIARGTAAIKLQ
jgi:hypothetical protein